jgi:hypothetical protein
MMKKLMNQKKKLSLTLDMDFYEELQRNADREFMRITNFTKWFLHKHLRENNKPEKCPTENVQA